MQENIETKNIGNRKFIIELRFDPKVSMLDKKGLLAEQIENCKAFNINHWEIGQSEVSIRDHEDKEKATNIVAVTFNRLSFISFKINTWREDKFERSVANGTETVFVTLRFCVVRKQLKATLKPNAAGVQLPPHYYRNG